MRMLVIILFASIILSAQQKSTVSILGVFDFENPKLDGIENAELSSSKKQSELEELVNSLTKFKPNKIAVESNSDQKNINVKLMQYLSNNSKLSMNSAEQIGFRLAEKINLQKLIVLDFPRELSIEEIKDLLDKNSISQEGLLKTKIYGKRALEKRNDLYKNETLIKFLKILNSSENLINSYFIYTNVFLAMGSTDSDKEVIRAMILDWYQQNLKTVQNLYRAIDLNDYERILIITRLDNVKLLTDILSSSPYFNVVDITNYLE